MNKKSVLYIFFALQLLAISTSCKNCECNPENTLAMNDTIFNNKFECLDIQFLEKNGLPSYDDPNGRFGYSYKEKDFHGYLKISIIGGGGKRNYKIYINIDHSRYLSIYKIYYPNGKIKEKCLKNDFGFFYG